MTGESIKIPMNRTGMTTEETLQSIDNTLKRIEIALNQRRSIDDFIDVLAKSTSRAMNQLQCQLNLDSQEHQL